MKKTTVVRLQVYQKVTLITPLITFCLHQLFAFTHFNFFLFLLRLVLPKPCQSTNRARGRWKKEKGGGFSRYLSCKLVSNASVGHNFTAKLASIIQTSIYQTKRLEQQKINQNFFLKNYQKQTRQSKKIYFFCFF